MSEKTDTLVAVLTGVAIMEIAGAALTYMAIKEMTVEGVNIVNVPVVGTIRLQSGGDGVKVNPGPKAADTISRAPYIVVGAGVVGAILTLLLLSDD